MRPVDRRPHAVKMLRPCRFCEGDVYMVEGAVRCAKCRLFQTPHIAGAQPLREITPRPPNPIQEIDCGWRWNPRPRFLVIAIGRDHDYKVIERYTDGREVVVASGMGKETAVRLGWAHRPDAECCDATAAEGELHG